MKIISTCTWVAFYLLGSSLLADDALLLSFEGETAKDAAINRTITLENVVIMQAGQKAYADFDGKGALVVQSDPGLVFQSQDTFWCTALVNPQGKGRSVPLLSKGGNYRIALQPDGKPIFTYYSKGEWRSLVSELPLELNTWQQIATYFDSSRGVSALFIDGKVVATAKDLAPFQSTGGDPLYIGGSPVPGKDEIRGLLGYIGGVTIERAAPQDLPADFELGQKAFTAPSPF